MSMTLAPVINTVRVEIDLPKETHELVEAAVATIQIGKQQLADGFQFSDLGIIISQSMSQLITGLMGSEQTKTEWQVDPGGVLMAAGIGIGKIGRIIKG